MNLPLRFSAAPSPCETLKNSFLCSRQKNFFLFFRKTAEPRGASTRNQQEREQKRRDIGEDFSEKDWIKNTVAALHDRQRDGALRSFQEAELFWLRFWAVRLDVCAIMFRFHSRLSGFYGSVFFCDRSCCCVALFALRLRCFVGHIQNLLLRSSCTTLKRQSPSSFMHTLKSCARTFVLTSAYHFAVNVCSPRCCKILAQENKFWCWWKMPFFYDVESHWDGKRYRFGNAIWHNNYE